MQTSFGDPAVTVSTVSQCVRIGRLPWADFKHRMDIKQSRYVALDTQGAAAFTLEAYVTTSSSRQVCPVDSLC